MSRLARTAATPSSATTPAATGIAPSVREPPPVNGSRNARPSFCPYLITTWCSRCRRRSAALAWQNKTEVYGLLFKAASETMLTIAADPKHLGARIGITAVLHTWGSALTHHPHVHMIVPGNGFSLDGERFIPCRRRFFLPVRVLSRLFRHLFLERLAATYEQGRLILEGSLSTLASPAAFAAVLRPLRRKNWFVYAKRPFAGPKAVLAYSSARPMGRHFEYEAHRPRQAWRYLPLQGLPRGRPGPAQGNDAGDGRVHPPLLAPVLSLPKGFHRIRHYGLFANTGRAAHIARLRELLGCALPPAEKVASSSQDEPAETVLPPCPCCGGRMIVMDIFERGTQPRYRQPFATVIWFDTS